MKHLFQRLSGVLLLTLFLLVCSVLPAFAISGDGEYRSIDVNATLQQDGSAKIVERWDVNLDDDWSELYIPKTALGKMEIKNLRVRDLTDGVDYTNVGDEWNVGEGLSTDDKRIMKLHKCGTIENYDGVELCWGVSGNGRHKYAVSYEMSNVVQRYTDGYDGFNIQFVNAEMDPVPDHISVTIDTEEGPELTKENTKFWAFGFLGKTRLQDGKVIAESDEDGTIRYANVMCRFDGGRFAPRVNADISFRDLVETAFKGSDFDLGAYDSGNSGGDASSSTGAELAEEDEDYKSHWRGWVPVIAVASFVWFMFGRGKSASRDKGLSKRVNPDISGQEKREVLYSREIPFEGSLEESYMALHSMGELPSRECIMEAYLLKWLKNGDVRVEERQEKRLGGLLGETTKPSIVFERDKSGFDGPEGQFWQILYHAAGNDHVLQEKELKAYAQEHYEKLEHFFENVLNQGTERANTVHHVENVERKVLFVTRHQTVLTDEGRKRFLELIGFRKFLKDFTIVNERQARDVGLWGDYLVYAALFGIADEVAEQFKGLVPDFFEHPQEYGYTGAGWNTFDTLYLMHVLNNFSHTAYSSYQAGHSAAEVGTASSGGGGFSSAGGGGGFSGGGFGGGGR